ncbi:hypothetical protein OJAV_G00233340 [Oryzias javanicus]|uniref:Uncharacterized protein n=1 Tax=Oryzias javanicus TaxID=123683 RepID=A0A3S2MCK0_ORYJA|nr:hypothetical protein OJAV_G00233340 [Oryzias javanicus]
MWWEKAKVVRQAEVSAGIEASKARADGGRRQAKARHGEGLSEIGGDEGFVNKRNDFFSLVSMETGSSRDGVELIETRRT